METKIYSLDELKNLFLQELLNRVDGKVSKISDHSVLNGIAYGFARVFQKSMKDVAILESELFPEYAYGEYLDKIAERYGIAERRKHTGSSVFVKLVAESGSVYSAETCRFLSANGTVFVLENDFTVSANGWGYAKLKSLGVGEAMNVEAYSIAKVTGQPSGHQYVINELPATGGVDEESDADLMQRILQSFNSFSFETLEKILAVMQRLNPNVLMVKKLGLTSLNQVRLGVVSVNGVSFTTDELNALCEGCAKYLSLQDIVSASGAGSDLAPLVCENLEEEYFDLDFRVDLDTFVKHSDFVVEVQQSISRLFDFYNRTILKVEWEDVFALIRNLSGVKFIPSESFYFGDNTTWSASNPHSDRSVPLTKIPRLRMCVIRDMSGTILSDNNKNVVPYYFGAEYTNVFDEINSLI